MFLQLIQTAVSREAYISDFEAFSLQRKRRSTKKMSASFVLIFSLAYPWNGLIFRGLFQYCLGTAITVNDERRDWSTKWIVLLSADTRIWLERLVSSSRPSYRPLPCLHESQGTLQHLYVQVHFNFIHQFHWCLHPLLKLLFFFNFLQKLIVVH